LGGQNGLSPQPPDAGDVSRPLAILPFDESTFWSYGELRAGIVERRGTPIGSLDAIIAAQALSQQATLVTNNTL